MSTANSDPFDWPAPATAAPQPIGWVCTAQDWRGRPPGSTAKPPKVVKTWFATKAEAEAHKAHQRELNPSPDYLLCVSPAVLKRGKAKEIKKPAHKGAMDWR